MSANIFLPSLKKIQKDSFGSWLRLLGNIIFLLFVSLLPIVFLPTVAVSLGLTKTFVAVLSVAFVAVLLSLSVLRKGVIKTYLPWPLVFFWFFVLSATVSAFLSGNWLDSFWGNALEVQTAGFLVLLAVVFSISLVVGRSKTLLVKLAIGLSFSALLLELVQVLRLFFGANFLSFGLFTSNTSSYLGGFNDLALFAGLVLILSLLLVNNLFLDFFKNIFLTIGVILSLILLVAINFSLVWLVVGGFSLLILLYSLAKDTWLNSDKENNSSAPLSKLAFILTGVTVLLSAVFIVGGSWLGTSVSQATGVSYLEIRPSLDATAGIMKQVWSDNVLLGNGPNNFSEAWRQFKSPEINLSNFWDTTFPAGSSLLATWFVTLGVLGGGLFAVFLLLFVFSGYRALFVKKLTDFWLTAATLLYVSATYLWFMVLLYTPGAVTLLLAVVFSGLALATYTTTWEKPSFSLDVTANRRLGLVLITLVVAVLGFSAFGSFVVTKQFMAQVEYSKAIKEANTGADLTQVDARLEKASLLFPQDIFVAERAQLRTMQLNALNTISEPTEQDRNYFDQNLREGLDLSLQAISLGVRNPINYALFYNFLGFSNDQSEEVKKRQTEIMDKMLALDPQNPSYHFLAANWSFRTGDFVTAREKLSEALSLKGNYIDALLLLAQVDVAEEKTEDAIAVTASVINLEPNNSNRFVQLGMLLTQTERLEEAGVAFLQAIRLDGNVNARYYLALVYLDLGQPDLALEQLNIVKETNPDNMQLLTLIDQVEAGEVIGTSILPAEVMTGDDSVELDGEAVTAKKAPETGLLNALNPTTVVGENTENEENKQSEEVATPKETTEENKGNEPVIVE